jgi:hypothetical protein
VEARQTFVFSAKAGMHISFVPADTIFLPPEGEGTDDATVSSSIEKKWRSEGAEIFDIQQTEGNLGKGEEEEVVDYQEVRERLQRLFRKPDDPQDWNDFV